MITIRAYHQTTVLEKNRKNLKIASINVNIIGLSGKKYKIYQLSFHPYKGLLNIQ